MLFYLTARDLSVVDEAGHIRLDPGAIELYVGGGQPGTGVQVLQTRIHLTGNSMELAP